jgi:hypothetical protein
MAERTKHARILAFPCADSLSSARLDALHDESCDQHHDLAIDYHELCLLAPPELFSCDEGPRERVRGHYVPRRLRFVGVRWLECTGLYTQLEALPLDHDARSLRGMLHWRPPGKQALYLLLNGAVEPATLMLSARRCVSEERSGAAELVVLVRDWSPPPSLPARLVPAPKQLQRRYGGDPVAIWLGGRVYHRRLFVGGVDCQSDRRPSVDAVLNLGEDPSRWAVAARPHPADRWACKGEGKGGMGVAEIVNEAEWVVDRLHAGQRVLVHCSAGLNRSVTVCCAALILLEGLSAEAALDRVREHHPWARPDGHHWLTLRWLAHTSDASILLRDSRQSNGL